METNILSGTATPRSKLDGLSKEDLIKLLKKQQLSVNKYKQENEELVKKVQDLESVQSIPNGGNAVSAADSEKSIESLSSENLRLIEELTAVSERLSSFEVSAASASASVQLLQNQIKAKTTECESLTAQFSELSLTLEAANSSRQSLLDELRQKDVRLSELESQVTENRASSISHDRADQCESNSSADETVTALRAQLALIEREKSAFEAQADRLSGENSALGQTVASLQHDLQERKAEVTKLQDSLADATAEVSKAEHAFKAQTQLAVIQEENQLLRQALTERREMYERAFEENEKLLAERADVDRKLEELEKQNQELQTKLKWVEAKFEEEKQTHGLCKQELKRVVEELSSAQENASKSNVFSLEMADYERGVQNMQQEIGSLRAEVVRVNQLLESKQNELNSTNKELETQKSLKEKSSDVEKKLKMALMKSKKDNTEATAKLEEREQTITSLNDRVTELQRDLETIKFELSDALGAKEQSHGKLLASIETKDRQLHQLETLRTKLQMEVEAAQNQLANVQNDYESYKVRVHNVLKQQRKSVEEETWQFEKDHLTKTVELVQDKLKETTQRLSSLQIDYNRLQDEHDSLLQKHKDFQHSATLKENSLKMQSDKLISESQLTDERHSQLVRQLTQQNSQAKMDFQEQLAKAKQDYEEAVQSYEDRIAFLESELASLRRQLLHHANSTKHHAASSELSSSSAELEPTHAVGNNAVSGGHKSLHLRSLSLHVNPAEPSGLMSPPFSERAPGEGSEETDRTPIHSPTMPMHGTMPGGRVMPLEDLLNTNFDSLSVASFPETASFDHAEASQAKISKAVKRIEHLTEVLNESEANNARLAEQAKVLKEEIRRLERNKEREQHLANIEYLKNVILKFFALKPGDERLHLLPVLTTMLRLSPDESAMLNSIATGGQMSADAKTAAGWSSYLHRWSGMT